MRLYALHERQNGKWVRISNGAYPKKVAVQLFQSALLAYVLGGASNERSLRPV